MAKKKLKEQGKAPSHEDWPLPKSEDQWKDFIHEDYIECMICGYRGDLLTEPHLRSHGGTKRLYHVHFRIPSDVKLASRALIAQRRRHLLENGMAGKMKKAESESDLAALLGYDRKNIDYSDLDQALSLGRLDGKIDPDF